MHLLSLRHILFRISQTQFIIYFNLPILLSFRNLWSKLSGCSSQKSVNFTWPFPHGLFKITKSSIDFLEHFISSARDGPGFMLDPQTLPLLILSSLYIFSTMLSANFIKLKLWLSCFLVWKPPMSPYFYQAKSMKCLESRKFALSHLLSLISLSVHIYVLAMMVSVYLSYLLSFSCSRFFEPNHYFLIHYLFSSFLSHHFHLH